MNTLAVIGIALLGIIILTVGVIIIFAKERPCYEKGKECEYTSARKINHYWWRRCKKCGYEKVWIDVSDHN